LKKLNKIWYEAEDIKDFTLAKSGFHFKELSTTFIKQKLVVTSSSGEENIELATYMQNILKDYRRTQQSTTMLRAEAIVSFKLHSTKSHS
jgi:hypothetical protein